MNSYKQSNIKDSFNLVKSDISTIFGEISAIKEVLTKQNQLILKLTKEIIGLSSKKNNKEEPLFLNSTRNEGVNQSINHLNIGLNTQPKRTEKDILEGLKPLSTRNEGVKDPSAHVKSKKEAHFKPNLLKKRENNVLRMAKEHLNIVFKKISKQELKTFLTVYQLEDEGLETSYRTIAERMDLSEHCIRAHIWSLFKKKAPLYKVKLNNRLTLLFIDKDFKSLNLKQKLINSYYKTDPNQKTLFDLYI